MRQCFHNFSNGLHRFIKSDKSTLYKLNYLTLNIDSKEITQDLFQHSLNQKISLFWIGNLLAFLNFLASLLSFI